MKIRWIFLFILIIPTQSSVCQQNTWKVGVLAGPIRTHQIVDAEYKKIYHPLIRTSIGFQIRYLNKEGRLFCQSIVSYDLRGVKKEELILFLTDGRILGRVEPIFQYNYITAMPGIGYNFYMSEKRNAKISLQSGFYFSMLANKADKLRNGYTKDTLLNDDKQFTSKYDVGLYAGIGYELILTKRSALTFNLLCQNGFKNVIIPSSNNNYLNRELNKAKNFSYGLYAGILFELN